MALNVHFHSLFLDGVYALDHRGYPQFHPVPAPTDEDVVSVAQKFSAPSTRCWLTSKTTTRPKTPCWRPCRARPSSDGSRWVPGAASLYAVWSATAQLKHASSADAVPRSRGSTSTLTPASLRTTVKDWKICAVTSDDHHYPTTDLNKPRTEPDPAPEKPWSDGTTHLAFEPRRVHRKTHPANSSSPSPPRSLFWGICARSRLARIRGSRTGPVDSGSSEPPRPTSPRRHHKGKDSLGRSVAPGVSGSRLGVPGCHGRMRLISAVIEAAEVERILKHMALPSSSPAVRSPRGPPPPNADRYDEDHIWD